MYQQQKRYNRAMDRFRDFKLGIVIVKASQGLAGSGSLKLQRICNCHVF